MEPYYRLHRRQRELLILRVLLRLLALMLTTAVVGERFNIWNFDETCLVNDPGRLKCVVKRGTRYPERVINHTKAGVSMMFCGNAEGEILPPYCVYKSTAVIMDSWIRGGPQGARYNRSNSGWFDESIFENWFNEMLLPRLKNQDGTKVIIGDNLSSHISEAVIRKCTKYNVKFICLPPNSTHFTQPLDVAYFHPMKVEWRKILNNFRKTKVGQKESSVPKDLFPDLLKQLVDKLAEGNGKQSLINGFRKCGIVPCDAGPLLERLHKQPSTTENNAAAMDQSLIDILTEMRADGPSRAKKSKKVHVVPGQSVTEEDITQTEELTITTTTKRKTKTSSSTTKTSSSTTKTSSSTITKPATTTKTNKSKSMTVAQPLAQEPVFEIGSYVKVVKGSFCGLYASIIGNSYGDEWEINYFMEKSSYRGKYWVLKPKDLDSREEDDLALVRVFPDEKGRFMFEDIQ